MTHSHNLFSFFSGAGFLDLGFETLDGFNVKFTNEIHPPFVEAYQYSRMQMGLELPEFGNYGNSIETLIKDDKALQEQIRVARRESDFVGFIGGPPCPDFSIGGKNRGRQGDKGVLSQIYIDLIVKYKPDYFLFENVKGLWRTKKHRAFYEHLKTCLYEADYALTEKLINAIEYGVPQDRDRIILIGFRRSVLESMRLGVSQDGPKTSFDFPWNKHTSYNKKEVFALQWPDKTPFEENISRSRPIGIRDELTVQHWFEQNYVHNHPNSQHHFQPRAGRVKMLQVYEGDDSKKSYKRLHRWRYSPTAAYGNNEVHLHPYKVRRISAAEALAIQSLPAQFVLPDDMSLTNMFKTIGNGVPYLVAKGLAMTIRDFLGEKNVGITYIAGGGFSEGYLSPKQKTPLPLYKF